MTIEKITLNPIEAAKYLGIPYGTLLQWCREKKIPHTRVARRIFFRQIKLDEWLTEMETSSIDRKSDVQIGTLRRIKA